MLTRLTSNYSTVPKGRTRGAHALFSSGSVVGYVVAAPLIAILTMKFGERADFLFPGLLGLVWLAAWLTVYLNHLGIPALPSGKGKAHAGSGACDVLRSCSPG